MSRIGRVYKVAILILRLGIGGYVTLLGAGNAFAAYDKLYLARGEWSGFVHYASLNLLMVVAAWLICFPFIPLRGILWLYESLAGKPSGD